VSTALRYRSLGRAEKFGERRRAVGITVGACNEPQRLPLGRAQPIDELQATRDAPDPIDKLADPELGKEMRVPVGYCHEEIIVSRYYTCKRPRPSLVFS
ncbi:hypothetical protein IH799_04485, partial [candidate division KSB1 bacterium]|nr:hypothetical protein [candidate division KSB1 bacterium]